jgi:hypothetical protein
LSDFDLAIDMKDENMTTASHLHRTGTLPFLAISLLLQLKQPELRFSYTLRFDLESCIYVFLWDAMYHPEGRNTPKSQVEETNELLDLWLSTDPGILSGSKRNLPDDFTSEYVPDEARESFPYLFRCRTHLAKLLNSLSLGYPMWKWEATEGGLDTSTEEWKDLCGKFTFKTVLGQFKAVQTALTASDHPLPRQSTSHPLPSPVTQP